MEYREFPVPKSLERHLQCIWRLRASQPGPVVHTIYPDGRCELLAHLATPPRAWHEDDGWREQAPTLFAAQRVSAVRLQIRAPLDCIGARLRPAASAAVVGASLARLRERVVDLALHDASLSVALSVAATSFAADRPAPLWELLARHCATLAIDPRIESAVVRLELTAGAARIASIASAAALALRTFQTRFRAQVGLTPKEFGRLMRLQATLRALDGGEARIAEVASAQGFADQAHATRELRRTIGLAPAQLRTALRRDRDGDETVRMAAAFVRGRAG